MASTAKFMPKYVLASVILSFAGLLNGYDTGCIGAIAHMKQFNSTMGDLSPTMLGITVSMIMLTGIIPSLFAGYLADKYGRLRIILPGASLFAVGGVLQGTAFGLSQFITGRAISGAGQGLFLANVSVYISEIAPAYQRGRLGAMPQFVAALGVCVGYFCCYGTAFLETSLSWRLPYILQVAVSMALAIACLILPEPPRWLMLQGKTQKAMQALSALDFDMEEARRDFLTTSTQQHQQLSLTGWQSFVLLFRSGYRLRTLMALLVLSLAQLSGIDAITYVRTPMYTLPLAFPFSNHLS